MTKRDSQEVSEMGWHSGYDVACNEWKEKIENIKAEIEQNEREVDFMNDYADGYNSGLYDALGIIDKHVSGKE